MKTEVIQIIMSFLGSLGFALIFNLRKKHLICASIGGIACWASYLVTCMIADGVYVPTVVASAVAALYAELFARILKVPATVIFVSAIVPLIPGSSLFYTMSSVVSGDMTEFGVVGSRTLFYVLGITSGISIVWSSWYMFQKLFNNLFRSKKGVNSK